MDKTETASLMDLRIGNSLEAEDAQSRSNSNSIIASSSMNDINNEGDNGMYAWPMVCSNYIYSDLSLIG